MNRLLLAMASAAIAVLANGVAGAEPAVPSFVEETASDGISTVYSGEWEFMVGGGAAAFDCSGDGFPDLFLAGGASHAGFYRNISRQGGELRFEKQASGLELEAVTGAYALDIDSDGIKDLVLLRVGENVVMRGRGNCRFERANEMWGFDGGDAWSTALAATWEDGADFPAIAVGNYIDRREEGFPWGSCTDNWLHRAEGARFAAPMPLKPSHCALSMLFTDWNRSGTPSLRVSNDREYYKGGQEQLWRIEAGAEPYLYSAADGWERLRIWGMGIAGYDLNFDGYQEYFLTSMADNKLQTLTKPTPGTSPGPAYTDAAFAKGVTAHRPYAGENVKPSTAWHAQFEDMNNDGLADLFIAKGNVAAMPDFAMEDPNNLLLQKTDGSFAEAGDRAGIGSTAISRGAVIADFNLDGMLDLAVVNRWVEAQLWRNTGLDNANWIQIRPLQPRRNRDAIGGWIEVKRGDVVMRREITVGGGHAGGHLGWWHFGLGGQTEAQTRIVWPDGEAGAWEELRAGHFYTIERGRGAARWQPG
ncbi:CRTAC1 family protein [Mesorhizobium sp. Z1-4]|uniref:CRTAC1 family protein n=1 Tax=Mesorhizobium sp. Z1-4 TaxID=2448478 RepID=UPI000FD7D653|nr:CRTAC1 family protein [Mesorhizobium sp. Z1-4]